MAYSCALFLSRHQSFPVNTRLVAQAAVQEAQLREANLELERQKALERRLQDEMRAKEEHAIAIEEQFSNVQEEVTLTFV